MTGAGEGGKGREKGGRKRREKGKNVFMVLESHGKVLEFFCH